MLNITRSTTKLIQYKGRIEFDEEDLLNLMRLAGVKYLAELEHPIHVELDHLVVNIDVASQGFIRGGSISWDILEEQDNA